jgi:hypothetical protein
MKTYLDDLLPCIPVELKFDKPSCSHIPGGRKILEAKLCSIIGKSAYSFEASPDSHYYAHMIVAFLCTNGYLHLRSIAIIICSIRRYDLP